MHISSYPSIYNVGHRAIASIFSSPVVVEEKVDGSQFSMCVKDGQLSCRSKGKDIVVDAPEKMFLPAIETAKGLVHAMKDGWVYRCEYLAKPKHNSLAYERIPRNHLILFDVMTGPETYLSPEAKAEVAASLGLEVVPLIYVGRVGSAEQLESFMDRISVLGNVKIEGVVVKNYSMFTPDKKIAIAKFVSDEFKEVHRREWKKSNPPPADFTQSLIKSYGTEARWRKAVQHLRESGVLTESPKDIGSLIKEVGADVLKEEADAIKDALFRHYWPKINRGIIAGLPEWYKKEVSVGAFPEEPPCSD